MTTMTGKLGERFGCTIIMSIGVAISTFANLLLGAKVVATDFVSVVLVRAVGAMGLGMAVPIAMPVIFYLIIPGKMQTAISIVSMMLPIGTIVSALTAGIVAEKMGWNYMCVFVGLIGVIGLISEFFTLPYRMPVNKKARIDFISTILLAGGLVCLILGLISLTQKDFLPVFVSVILVVGGLALIVLFAFYDQKFSKNQLF